MIIWGSVGKDKRIGTGQFYCPTCRVQSQYAYQRVSRYFTLYFIPLFPTETLGEYLRCLGCKGHYKPFIKELSAEQVEALVSPWPCGNCGNRNAAEQAYCLSCGARKDYVAPQPSAAEEEAVAVPLP
jgi:hypothetical protein